MNRFEIFWVLTVRYTTFTMETLANYACVHAHIAHWIIFFLLMLAGLNVPISEDILLLTGGAIGSMCIPDHVFRLFFWIYIGCWVSAWEAYWIGRLLGPKLYTIRWFSHVITPQRIERLHHYYEKFGIFTFMVGRFIPGGVRNALFMSSGLGKMPFLKFILRDGFACIFSSTTIFSIGYYFGQNFHTIVYYFETYNKIVLVLIFSLILIMGVIVWIKNRNTMVT